MLYSEYILLLKRLGKQKDLFLLFQLFLKNGMLVFCEGPAMIFVFFYEIFKSRILQKVFSNFVLCVICIAS